MKSGRVVVKSKAENEFKYSHKLDKCSGEWRVSILNDIPYSIEENCLLIIKDAPFIECPKCKAMYYVPGFEDWLLKRVAHKLIVSGHLLSKVQLRFLRVLAGLTQKEIAESMGIPPKEYCKFESKNDKSRFLSADRQIRFRIKLARQLGLENEVNAFDIADNLDDQWTLFPTAIDETPREYLTG